MSISYKNGKICSRGQTEIPEVSLVNLADNLTAGDLNVYNYCRICMNEFLETISIFDIETPLLGDVFSLFTSIQISRNDGLPPNLCIACKEQLIVCLDFKQQCEKADVFWKTNLNRKLSNKIKLKPGKQNTEETYEVHFSEYSTYDTFEGDNDSQYLKNVECVKREHNEEHRECPNYNECDNFEDENTSQYLEKVKCKEESLEEEIAPALNTYCEEPIIEPSELKVHQNGSNQEDVYNCEYCAKRFSKAWSLKRHIRNFHVTGNALEITFPCKHCNESFSSAGDLRIHSSLHNEGGIKCIQCFKEFALKQQLQKHVLRHMEDKKYKCDQCPMSFCQLFEMHKHQRVHTGETLEKKHACKVCYKRFVRSYDLKVHFQRHVVSERSFVCAHCGKAFMSANLLSSHIRIHNDNKPYKCDHCDKRFRDASTRRTHHRTHTGEKPYICSICGKCFIQNSNLRLHLRTHSGEKPYKCKICEKPFSSSSTLKAHQLTHSGEKQFECPICGKRLARSSEHMHMRLHSGKKPYQCGVCNKHFYTASRLRTHTRVHTGEKPFECNSCSETFTNKSHLVKHINTHGVKMVEQGHGNKVKEYTAGLIIKGELKKEELKEIDVNDYEDK